MRKLLIGVLILCLLSLAIFMIVKKIEIGNFEILGIKEILQKNSELDEEIKTAKITVEDGMENKKKELDTAYNKMNSKKAEYESLVATSTEEEVKTASQFLTYNVEFLWTRIGNHAKSEGVKLKIDFIENSTVSNNYNLNFTATGTYNGITEFLYNIENDSELGFKIENFNITSGTEEQGLVSTFICKNITVNGIEKVNTTEENKTQDTNENKESKESKEDKQANDKNTTKTVDKNETKAE